METTPANKPKVNLPANPKVNPKVSPKVSPKANPENKPKPRSHAKSQVQKSISLPIPEKLLTLAIDDAEGALPASLKTTLRFGLAGALLAELTLANRIQLGQDHSVHADPAESGDILFDDILVMITAENKPRKLGHWVQAIGSKLTIKQVTGRLVQHKVIALEKKRYSWVIPYEAFPQVQASAKYSVKQHLRGIVLTGELVDAPDITLLSLLKACGLLRLVFTRDERKAADKKVNALVQGEVLGEAVAKLIARK